MSEAEKAPEKTNERPQFDPGWYRDLSNEEYHGSSGFSSSQIKTLMEKTPAHLRHGMTTPNEETANMLLGSAVHSLVLEPGKFADEFATMPNVNKRTNAGKAEVAAFEELHAGKSILNQTQADTAQKMAASVMNHDKASILLTDIVAESSVYWWYKSMDADDDSDYKIMMKVRPDALSRGHPVVVDLKTTKDGSYTGFIKSVQNFGYHISAAMYLEGINQCQPLLKKMGYFAYTKFVFVCVENVEPYLTSVYELSPEYLDLGKTFYRRGVRALREGMQNDWPGFPDDIRILEPPPWASRGFIV